MSTPSIPEPPPVADQARWFAKEVHPHDGQLKAYLRSSFPSVRDVDDVVQESYLRIWKARAAHPIAFGKPFLFRIARNLALDVVRRIKGSPIDSVADLTALTVVEDKPDAAAVAELHEKARLLGEALASLPDRYREIIVLRKFKDVSQKEVAARFGLSEEAVEHHVSRGLKRCEAYLRKCGIRNI